MGLFLKAHWYHLSLKDSHDRTNNSFKDGQYRLGSMTNLEIHDVKTIPCVTMYHTRVLVEMRFVCVTPVIG